MGTRAVIAREALLKGGKRGFAGRYHHWDGYPSGLGKTLHELYHGHFKRDLPAMLKYLIDDHPAGWSTIQDRDFTQPPGFEQGEFETKGPNCYCHGGRKEEAYLVTHKNAAGSGCEYAYVFDEANARMLVLSSFRGNGQKMVGLFGSGDKNAVWCVIGTVDLKDPHPPVWEGMKAPRDELQES